MKLDKILLMPVESVLPEVEVFDPTQQPGDKYSNDLAQYIIEKCYFDPGHNTSEVPSKYKTNKDGSKQIKWQYDTDYLDD